MSAQKTSKGAAERRTGEPRFGTGGRRLAEAFEAVSRLPALAEARGRLLEASERPSASVSQLTEVVESDTALTIAVMRASNNGAGLPGRCDSVRAAIEQLTPSGLRVVALEVGTYDVFASPVGWSAGTERFRRHAVAVGDAAERIAAVAGIADRDHVAATAVLHDVGRLVLAELFSGFDSTLPPDTTPEERLRAERVELGIDHALVGGVLARRWGLPQQISTAIERHHAPDAAGAAAVVKLADLVAHHADGGLAVPGALIDAAAALGLSEARLRSLLYEFPGRGDHRPAADPCPLSGREVEALRGLAEGKVYKQIAQELSLSVSTIRTHLHNVYAKIGAVDRAQAVLIARDRGWL
jgi:putative nucleotidyltransferase with HDIG domain